VRTCRLVNTAYAYWLEDIADEAQKAETGPVFNKIWFMIVGGLEYLS